MANIQQLTDLFRQIFIGGEITLTVGMSNMLTVDIYNITKQIQTFN